MKAIVLNAYGGPDVLELKEVDRPAVTDNDVLVGVHAASLNAGDYFSMRGSPWLARFTIGFPKPKDHILGWDVAGHVEAVGKNVTRFQPGDEVFASCDSTLAEYACAPEGKFAKTPTNLTLEQAAAVPSASMAALHALRDQAKVQPGQKVLIKPNLLSGKAPEKAVTTHPEIVRQVILLAQAAGGDVMVGDSPGLGKPDSVARKCGILDVVEDEVVAPPASGKVLFGVVDNVVCADRPHHVHVPRAADAGHLCPKSLRDLYREGSHASRGPIDQDFLPWLHFRLIAKSVESGD